MSMLWQRFTERAKRVVIAAQEEAAHAGEPYVSPEHLLLGLVKEPDSVATKVLERLGVAASRVRQELEQQIRARGYGRLNNNDVTLDPRMKRVLDFAYVEARQSNTNYIGTEHLLLGIIREGDGIAFRALAKLGVDIISSRKEVVAYLGGEQSSRPLRRQTFRGEKFTDATAAAEWLNDSITRGEEIFHVSSSGGELWLMVSGWTDVGRRPTPGDGSAAGEPQEAHATEPGTAENRAPARGADVNAGDTISVSITGEGKEINQGFTEQVRRRIAENPGQQREEHPGSRNAMNELSADERLMAVAGQFLELNATSIPDALGLYPQQVVADLKEIVRQWRVDHLKREKGAP